MLAPRFICPRTGRLQRREVRIKRSPAIGHVQHRPVAPAGQQHPVAVQPQQVRIVRLRPPLWRDSASARPSQCRSTPQPTMGRSSSSPWHWNSVAAESSWQHDLADVGVVVVPGADLRFAGCCSSRWGCRMGPVSPWMSPGTRSACPPPSGSARARSSSPAPDRVSGTGGSPASPWPRAWAAAASSRPSSRSCTQPCTSSARWVRSRHVQIE